MAAGSRDEQEILSQELLQSIRGEYLEIPGLFLTRAQVQSLWSLDTESCDRILDALITTGFLRRTEEDGFVRAENQ